MTSRSRIASSALQLVVVVLEQTLKSLGDVAFVDRQDDDLVVGQEVTLDREAPVLPYD